MTNTAIECNFTFFQKHVFTKQTNKYKNEFVRITITSKFVKNKIS